MWFCYTVSMPSVPNPLGPTNLVDKESIPWCLFYDQYHYEKYCPTCFPQSQEIKGDSKDSITMNLYIVIVPCPFLQGHMIEHPPTTLYTKSQRELPPFFITLLIGDYQLHDW